VSESKVLRDALEVLNNQGLYQQASELALKAARRESKAAATAAPAGGALTLKAAWKSAEETDGVLGLKHLRSLTGDQMGELQRDHRDLLDRSMTQLKAGE
jgi:hypothetical protein